MSKLKSRNYFEGWYFKHQSSTSLLSVIPGISLSRSGNTEAFIQIITPHHSYYVTFSTEQFHLQRSPFILQIDKNYFTENGILLDIHTDTLSLKGALKYGAFYHISPSIMGPFSKVPGMECKHDIISMQHTVAGHVTLNSSVLDFTDGTGYIESDYGSSFPSQYRWVQCLHNTNPTISLFSAVATIPLGKTSFTGTINCILCDHQLFRIATYLGAQIVLNTPSMLIIRQKNLILIIQLHHPTGQPLLAPQVGLMRRTVKEELCGLMECWLFNNGKEICHFENARTSYEVV